MNRLIAWLLVIGLVACSVPPTPPGPPTPASTSVSPTASLELSAASPTPLSAIVTTVAGRCYPTARDYVDGVGDEARFHKPWGLSVDAQGNLLVADSYNNCLRWVTPEGKVTTVAGVCELRGGYMDGPAAQARFYWPTHAISDAAGNVYVADCWNNRIRLITPDGTVSTLAGGDVGYRDGPGPQARFGRPTGLLLDPEGDILVADLDNNSIRKITPDGMVTTIAGAEERAYANGPALQARFGAPNSLAFDSAGNLYVAEAFYGHNLPGWPRVRVIAPDGTVNTAAGDGQRGFADGPALQAQFHYPTGPSVDRFGNVYLADDFNHRIRVIRPDGQVITLAGTGESGYRDGPAHQAQFDRPSWTVIGPDGALYVVDSGNNCIRKISLRE